MNIEYLENWKSDVLRLQEVEKTLDEDRNALYGEIASKLKRIFSQNGCPTRNIHFSTDGSVIEVTLTGNHSNSIQFTRKMVIELCMPFAVRRRITNKGETELYIELYPIDGE